MRVQSLIDMPNGFIFAHHQAPVKLIWLVEKRGPKPVTWDAIELGTHQPQGSQQCCCYYVFYEDTRKSLSGQEYASLPISATPRPRAESITPRIQEASRKRFFSKRRKITAVPRTDPLQRKRHGGSDLAMGEIPVSHCGNDK